MGGRVGMGEGRRGWHRGMSFHPSSGEAVRSGQAGDGAMEERGLITGDGHPREAPSSCRAWTLKRSTGEKCGRASYVTTHRTLATRERTQIGEKKPERGRARTQKTFGGTLGERFRVPGGSDRTQKACERTLEKCDRTLGSLDRTLGDRERTLISRLRTLGKAPERLGGASRRAGTAPQRPLAVSQRPVNRILRPVATVLRPVPAPQRPGGQFLRPGTRFQRPVPASPWHSVPPRRAPGIRFSPDSYTLSKLPSHGERRP